MLACMLSIQTSSVHMFTLSFVVSGRQVCMAYMDTVAKPPRDVRRQQIKYGTAGVVRGGQSAASSSSSSSSLKHRPYAPMKPQSPEREERHSRR